MSSGAFTCISCRVAFASTDLQRAHYKSDWHRYNLKRKVAELPPVTAADFKQRLLAQQSKTAEAQRDTSTRCGVCGKHFGTENAYTNHLQSKKHKDAEAKMKAASDQSQVSVKNAKNKRDQAKVDAYEGEKMKREGAEKKKKMDNNAAPPTPSSRLRKENKDEVADEVMDDDDEEEEWEDVEGEEIPPTDCLFCSQSTSSIEDNLHHMTVSHSFYLPNVEFIADMEGLLSYLGVKVGCDFMCLWCNEKGKSFYSLDSVQRHMRDKGHSKILYEGDAIYEYSDFYDFRKSYPDYDERNGGAVGGEMRSEDDEDEEEEMDLGSYEMKEEGFELTLPSGMKIGHRELSKYYKQNLPLERRVMKKNPALIGRLMSQYKALGWHGNKGEASEKMIRDLRYVQKFRSRQNLSLQVKANKFQKHFRCQNPI
ncbi:zinc finger protein 622-like [Lytechinus variegatus]|uniref:zinc finger protein 622-like n=1 Tax=Lytechinus variegatus TaxID=7654 RepID=UPI001BB16A6B|nr:zinc finger protein 622-like [Lytechinus variegatus]XP_041478385.1 zinc finger protein 622-like [Lytechinus variegatus]